MHRLFYWQVYFSGLCSETVSMRVVLIILLILLLAGLIYWPNIWVNRIFRKYSSPKDVFPGTGGELANLLLEKQGIKNVSVEPTEPGQDHYDPVAKMVRLSPDNYHGRSLTAITVAAHEVGHAVQHASGYGFFKLRHGLVQLAQVTEKLGSVAIFAMPIIALLSRSPAMGAIVFVLGIAGIAFGTLVHLVTLPVELDASFNRALPLLTRGEYISERQAWHARRILKAAAFTYVAGSLASLLNLARWVAILRR
jgi:Zn-dependent membrane protease YugP